MCNSMSYMYYSNFIISIIDEFVISMAQLPNTRTKCIISINITKLMHSLKPMSYKSLWLLVLQLSITNIPGVHT